MNIKASFVSSPLFLSPLYNTVLKSFPCDVEKPVFITRHIDPLSGGAVVTFFGRGSCSSFLSDLTTFVPAKIIEFLCFNFVSKIKSFK